MPSLHKCLLFKEVDRVTVVTRGWTVMSHSPKFPLKPKLLPITLNKPTLHMNPNIRI